MLSGKSDFKQELMYCNTVMTELTGKNMNGTYESEQLISSKQKLKKLYLENMMEKKVKLFSKQTFLTAGWGDIFQLLEGNIYD